ncbi:hypothetical protein ASE75_03495 [Sphingomonas sp. Leaf17]|uniref:hypothetical protein n=1 Tax=Sphingomonas sp. Leaf17 TaxID=1735683 RepID=UPI000701DE23|nr:hypothetical protein [Sphingomonas sp. Leaf17]KQM67951.1 hypothetical protein ASE75_03495 [Sphingomonas sp. Leaf17]
MARVPMFNLEEAIRAQRALRESLGLEEEVFPVEAFVEMISDEVEQMRAAGRSDADIVAIVARTTGQQIDPSDIATHYIAPEHRHGGRR